MQDELSEIIGKLKEWSPETAEQVCGQVVEIIELADQGLLDIVRARKIDQEVLDLLDQRSRERSLGRWKSISKTFRLDAGGDGRWIRGFCNTAPVRVRRLVRECLIVFTSKASGGRQPP
jgi:hypothetical protein